MVKLFILALVLIVGGAILGMTTNFNPALLIIAGFVCGFVAAFREARPVGSVEQGVASPGAATDARELSDYRFPEPEPYHIGPFTSHSGGGAP
jgi:MFS family permease